MGLVTRPSMGNARELRSRIWTVPGALASTGVENRHARITLSGNGRPSTLAVLAVVFYYLAGFRRDRSMKR